MSTQNNPPKVFATHITTDERGQTVTRKLPISGFTLQKTIDTRPPLWATPPMMDAVSRSIWVMPADWDGGWHPNPQKQWVIPLSGTWWVETQDGIRTTLGPSEISLGDDLDATPDELGRVGQGSGAVGGHPVVLLMIPVADKDVRD